MTVQTWLACSQTRTTVSTNAIQCFPGLNTPRAESTQYTMTGAIPAPPRATSQPPLVSKSVHFDQNSRSSPFSPGSSATPRRRHHNSNHDDSGISHSFPSSSSSSSPSPDRSRHLRRRVSHNDVAAVDVGRSPSPVPSDATVDLPDRFYKDGRRKPQKGEDPLADTLDEVLGGRGPVGKIFKSLVGGLGGAGAGAGGGGRRERRGVR